MGVRVRAGPGSTRKHGGDSVVLARIDMLVLVLFRLGGREGGG